MSQPGTILSHVGLGPYRSESTQTYVDPTRPGSRPGQVESARAEVESVRQLLASAFLQSIYRRYNIASLTQERKMWGLSRKGVSGFSSSSTALQVTQGIHATALTAIVTGASSGIGAETARVLALRGVHVIMGVIDMIDANNLKKSILKEIPTAKVDVMKLDLSSMVSVQNFATEFNSTRLPLNILINNAGICAVPFMLSTDNVELQFAINYLGHFHLTNLLLDNMKKTTGESKVKGRIVNVSSTGHRFTYHGGIHFEKINDPLR
uniref:Uncharacterized protein n=1 Tax=Phaseolus vulgaris TaxID=3885 RepID=V7C4N3_PHAVU|nr:hypothetical protein PHAVU_004G112500g [Phaseolus vulgaris]ESW24225.1 hypothetical protein PHAVU_004G112500g [Phaseolus vulgaris]